MRVIIIGAGVVGKTIAKKLSTEAQDVVIIEQDEEKIKELDEHFDVKTIKANGSSPKALSEAGIDKADMIIAVTNSDEVNMIACLIAASQTSVPKRIARIRNREYSTYTKIFEEEYLGLDLNINPEKAAADNILKIVEVPGAVDVVDFFEGRVRLVGCRITENCSFAGRSIHEIQEEVNEDKKLIIAAIYRGNRTIIPSGHTKVLAGDLVFAITKAENVKKTVTLLKGANIRSGKKVVIVGGGIVGFYLASIMEKEGYKVKVIERDKERCNFLAEEMDKAIIIAGDGTDQDLLNEEHIADVDTFIAVTNDEEANILTSLLAKRIGAERCITLIDKPEYISMVSTIGIDVAVSPRLSSVSSILQFVRQGKIVSVKPLMEERVEAIETIAMETSEIVDKPIQKIKLPEGAIIGPIIRGEEVIMPSGKTVIEAGDRVVIFALREDVKKVEKLLLVKPEFF